MAHPFSRMFDKALAESTAGENLVLRKAEQLKDKGYSVEEIHVVLTKMQQGLIDDKDSEIVGEAAEEFSRFIDV